MKLKIVPYKMTSESAKLLQKSLSDKVGYYVYRGRKVPDHKLIFWGRKPDKIGNFELMKKAKVHHVPYTTSKEVAQGWQKEGYIVYARTPGGQKGVNIDVVKANEELPDRPLYTRYVKNFTEFRVNVAFNKAIHVSQKRKSREDADQFIRSQSGGWGFRRPLFVPKGLHEVAVAASRAVGLDLSGVDILYNKFYNKFYVLEVNSAPWLNESIADKYATEIVNGLPAA
jgi:glutathione synthase/RimK-type ligase-like ATP-grasp enzyme